MSVVITLDRLRQAEACKSQRDLFRELFGESVTVTEAIVSRHARDFNWRWAARYLLPDSAWNEYQDVIAGHQNALSQGGNEAWQTYMTACHDSSLSVADHRGALKKFEDARDAVWLRYEKNVALTWLGMAEKYGLR